MTDRAERQVGERLSEEATAAMDWARAWAKYPGDDPQVEIGRYFLSLARQLAEAERENGRHEQRLAAWEQIVRTYIFAEARTRDDAERRFAGLTEAVELLAKTLAAPDPPASPAEGSENAHARAEHLREAREVEDHQEAKHGDV